MDISKSNIMDLAALRKEFVIPVYQRNYSWSEQECEQLLDDIRSIIHNDKTHFFGTFVYSDDLRNNRYFIVDGQQRLTSVMLLIRALIDVHPEAETNYCASYLCKNDGISKSVKLRLNKTDNVIFEKIILKSVLDEEEKESALYKNYLLFYNFFSSNKGYKPYDVEYALKRFEMAILIIDRENPQKIFDSVNFAGKRLDNMDRIKNYLLLPLDYVQQEKIYNEYWAPLEKYVKDRISDFFVDWLIVRNKSDSYTHIKRDHINYNTMYDVIVRDFPNINKENVEDVFIDILLYAELYNELLTPEKGSDLYHLIYSLDIRQALPLLLYTKSIGEDVNHCAKLIISYNVRAMLSNRKTMNRQNASNCIQRIDSYLSHGINFHDALNLSITSFYGNSAFVTDEDLKNALASNPVYNNKTRAYIKYVLFQIEKSIYGTTPEYEDGSIEHIIPQKPSVSWLKLDEDKSNIYSRINQIGNLTLLDANQLVSYNSKASNNPYEEKIKIYNDSIYRTTRDIVKEEPKFTLDSVDRRNRKLADIIIKMFRYPARIDVSFDEHNISENLGDFTGEKPASYSCPLLNEANVKTWAEMLVFVLEDLYEYDNKVFYDFVSKCKDLGIFDKKRRKVAEIGEYTIHGGHSTYDVLNYIKQALEFYDIEAGTNFVQDFRFKCKENKQE